MLTATVCGSFRRHLTGVYEAVQALRDAGVSVLSPSDPRVVDAIGGFVFVASDRGRSMKLVEDRHLAAIGACDFVWLVAPDGYVGPSAGMELGYALANAVPVFTDGFIADQTLRMYVREVPSIRDAMKFAAARREPVKQGKGALLLHPEAEGALLLERAQETLRDASTMRELMLKRHGASEMDPLYERVKADIAKLLLSHD